MGRKKLQELNVRVPKFLKDFGKLHNKHSLVSRFTIVFPQKRVPILVKIALLVINLYKGRVDMEFGDKRKN